MKLKENQLKLIRHLAKFGTLDYASCLRMLDDGNVNDKVRLSYVFRPLTKNKYLKRHNDDSVTILTKGKALFPEVKQLVTLGGCGAIKRINTISGVAMLMSEIGIDSFASPEETGGRCFVPSACWRKIRPGILSTTRFAGMLFTGSHRLAVYDIADGSMEWQLRAERSLFKNNYNDYKTEATGMLLICHDDKRDDIAQQIIRTTMWHRKTLIDKSSVSARARPVMYSKAPIRMASQYRHVYLTTPSLLSESIYNIEREENYIAQAQGSAPKCSEPKLGDYDNYPCFCYVNIATDLLKFVYFFAAVKSLINLRKGHDNPYIRERIYSITLSERDLTILNMYPDVINFEGLKTYVYRPDEDIESIGEETDVTGSDND